MSHIVLSRRAVLACMASMVAAPRFARAGLAINASHTVNDLGAELLKRMHRMTPAGNVVVAPVNLYASLLLLAAGANKATADGLRQTKLIAAGANLDGMLASFADVWTRLHADPAGAELKSGVNLWVKLGASPSAGYLKAVEGPFKPEAKSLNFATSQAAAEINDWVSKTTESKIDKIIERTDAETQLVIASAMYFKGSWGTPFDPKSTVNAKFHLQDGRTRDVACMSGTVSGGVWNSRDLRAVALPYGKSENAKYHFVVVQHRDPQRTVNFRRFNMRSALEEAHFAPAQIEVGLPKFGASGLSDMEVPLSESGLGLIFSSKAGFDSITGEGIGRPQVMHAVDVRIDEAGTEAAAATAIAGTRSAEPVVKFAVDRPFAFAICEGGSDRLGEAMQPRASLVYGIIMDPSV